MAQDDKFTTKQEMFCQHYVASNNATASAIKAGYAEGSAGVAGSRLLKDAKIQKRVSEIRKETMDSLDHDKDQVVQWLYDIASPLNGERTGNRIKALELLGKYHAMFTEKRYVESNNTHTVNEQFAELSEEELEEALKAFGNEDENDELFPNVVPFSK